MTTYRGSLLAMVLAGACSSVPATGGGDAGGIPLNGLLLRRGEVMAGPPASDLGVLRSWVAERSEGVSWRSSG